MESVPTAPMVSFDPGSQDFAWHAYERYSEMREQSPVYRLMQPDGTEVWLITRYEDGRAALADPRLSKDGVLMQRAFKEMGLDPAAGASDSNVPLDMLSRDPPEHGRHRRLVSRAFTPRRIERLRPTIEELTARLLDEMAGADEVDLLASFAYPLPIIVICDLVGVSRSEGERIRRLSDGIGEASPEAVAKAYAAFNRYLFELVRSTAPLVRRDIPEDDQPGLLHALLVAAEHDDRLSQDEIVDTIRLLLAAGHSTTAHLIGNGMLALLQHPDQRDLMVRCPDLLPTAVEELLRYDGPAERTTHRISVEPITIGGITIPAHRMVYVVLASADHDPGHFPDPDRLDVSRPCPQHLGFGHGAHFCLGAPLARLETQIALGRLLARFPKMELACPVEDLRYQFAGYLMRGLSTLPVRLHGEGTG